MPKGVKETKGNNKENKEVSKKFDDKTKSSKPKKSQRRKKKNWGERAYKPRGERKVNTQAFSTENLLKLMQSAASPAKKAVVINSTKTHVHFDNAALQSPTKPLTTQVLSPSKVNLSTPEKGPRTSYVTTPKGSKLRPSRIIECDDGAYALFVSEDKVANSEMKIPSTVNEWVLKKSPIPKDSFDGFEDYEITKVGILATEKLVKQRKDKNESARLKSQNDLMKFSANKALREAGFTVDDNTGHWLDFIPHNFIGDASRTVKNLGLGTRFANASMELVNRAIKQLLFQKDSPYTKIYLTVKPKWVPGFENIRLLQSLKVIIKDDTGDAAKHKASITFNCLTLAKVCLTDVKPIKQFILRKFSEESKCKQVAIPVLRKPAPAAIADINAFNSTALLSTAPKDLAAEDDFIIHKPLTFAFRDRTERPLSPFKPNQKNQQQQKTVAKRNLFSI